MSSRLRPTSTATTSTAAITTPRAPLISNTNIANGGSASPNSNTSGNEGGHGKWARMVRYVIFLYLFRFLSFSFFFGAICTHICVLGVIFILEFVYFCPLSISTCILTCRRARLHESVINDLRYCSSSWLLTRQ